MMLSSIEVKTSAQLKQFIDFPHDLYATDPNYVPELFIAQRDLLTPGKHPFHEHSSLQCFLAMDGNVVKGRIAAIDNVNHNKFNHTSDGFFGFFDCIDDQNVAKCLLDAASEWLKKKNVHTLVGPVNFSTNETCGLLIEGFDKPPIVMMTYNKPYYAGLLEKYGLKKYTDLLAYNLETNEMSAKSIGMSERLEERLAEKGIKIRSIRINEFKSEVEKVLEVYNSAWDKNLGFVPMTSAEFTYLAKDLKLILDKDFCLVAEQGDKFVGFFLGIPNLNEALIHVKRGRLLPTGLFKLLYHKRKIKQLRIIAMGVISGYRKMGIEACFFARSIQSAKAKGYVRAEASWLLEDNTMMNQAMINIHGTVYKKYRIYSKPL